MDVQIDPQAETRCRLAAIAARLITGKGADLEPLTWRELIDAPAWLALPDDEFALLQRRLGALFHAKAISLWMDRPRLAAAQQSVGESWLRDLCAQRPVMPLPVQQIEPIDNIDAKDVATRLSATGATLLVASIPPGPMRDAVTTALGISQPAAVNEEVARSFIARLK